MTRLLTVFFAFTLLLVPSQVAAKLPDDCTGSRYKTKTNNVPVYEEPDSASKVFATLTRGEEVCYVGERGTFAIIHWKTIKSDDSDEVQRQVGYIVRQLLLEGEMVGAEVRAPDDLFSSMRRYYYYFKSGGIAEDALLPYRPLMAPFQATKENQSENVDED